MNPTLDNNVLLGFQNGEESAFKIIFNHYYPQLFGFALKLIESTDEADDITIIAFQKLFSISHKFETEINVRAFLYLTVRNRCLNYLKSRKVKSDHHHVIMKDLADDALFTYEYEIGNEIQRRVRAAIDNLPAECGRVFKLLFYEELSAKEVADALKISVNTVYTQRRRAMDSLRLMLSENSKAIIWLLSTIMQIEACHHGQGMPG